MNAKRMSFGVAAALLAMLALLLLVVACSDDGDDAEPKATKVSATEPADAEPTATESADAEPTDATEPEPTAAAAETSVDVSLNDQPAFVVEPSIDSVSAGAVTFNVSNDGAIPHNLRVIATDLAPDSLPTDDATFTADEAQLDVVASTTQDLLAGDTEELTVDLEAGNYVLICNFPTHYDVGMRVAFTVE